jgi:hypothetical protein
MIGGELILAINKGTNLCQMVGLDKFAFKIELPQYDEKGKVKKAKDLLFNCNQDLETDKFMVLATDPSKKDKDVSLRISISN